MDKLTQIKQDLLNETKDTKWPIDDDILDLVIALNYLGFPTDSSCQGHHEENGRFCPWVMITNSDEGIDFDKNGEYYKFAMTNLDLQKRLIPLLNEFYNNRDTEHQHRIICSTLQCAMMEFIPQSGYLSEFITDKAERKKLHAIYKQEFDDFKEFLESKF